MFITSVNCLYYHKYISDISIAVRPIVFLNYLGYVDALEWESHCGAPAAGRSRCPPPSQGVKYWGRERERGRGEECSSEVKKSGSDYNLNGYNHEEYCDISIISQCIEILRPNLDFSSNFAENECKYAF